MNQSQGAWPFFVTKNVGQSEDSILFQSGGLDGRVAFEENAFIISRLLTEPGRLEGIGPLAGPDLFPPATVGQTRVRFELAGSSQPVIHGEELLPTRIHYLNAESGDNCINLNAYGRLVYENIYPGIDLVFYEQGGELEFDFIVAPGIAPDIIALNIEGGQVKWIGADGNLSVETEGGQLLLQRPVIYQDTENGRQLVTGGFRIDEAGRVGFSLGDYDSERPLVIDPVAFYSNYIGGTNDDGIYDMAIDSQGRPVVAGYAASSGLNFGGGAVHNGGLDAIVARYSTSGVLEFLTYFGGAQDDIAYGIALGADDRIYICGATKSELGSAPYQAVAQEDGFVARLAADGSSVNYQMNLAGTSSDFALSVVVDDSDQAYVVGQTYSSDFLNGAGGSLGSYEGAGDIFIVKIFSIGNGHFYSRYIGGSGEDLPTSAGIYKDDAVIVGGSTESPNFPGMSSDYSYQINLKGTSDGVVTWLKNSDGAVLRSTYFGNNGSEKINGINVQKANSQVMIVGESTSGTIPATSRSNQGAIDTFAAILYLYSSPYEFVLKMDSGESFGGSGDDIGQEIRLGPQGGLTYYIAGSTTSVDLPGCDDDPSYPSGGWDAFAAIIELYPMLIDEYRSTYYFGGTGNDRCYAMAIDGRGAFTLAGKTASSNIEASLSDYAPLDYGGSGDGFLTELKPGNAFALNESIPADSARSIDPSTTIRLFFNREVAPSSFTGGITLTREDSGSVKSCDIVYDSPIRCISIYPDTNLKRDSWYTLSVDAGVCDLFGEALPMFEIRFKTEPASDEDDDTGCFFGSSSN